MKMEETILYMSLVYTHIQWVFFKITRSGGVGSDAVGKYNMEESVKLYWGEIQGRLTLGGTYTKRLLHYFESKRGMRTSRSQASHFVGFTIRTCSLILNDLPQAKRNLTFFFFW